MSESVAVAVRDGTEVSEKLERSPEEAAYRVMMHQAKVIAESGLFGVKNPQQALALMLVSQAEGRHPALAARDYDIIQGRPSKKAEAMLRDFLAGDGSVEWHELSEKVADATFSHPQGGTVRIAWTIERAKQIGLTGKDNWKNYPRAMLRSRVVSEGVRTVYPAATSGMYVPEEVQDFTERGGERSGAQYSEARPERAENKLPAGVAAPGALVKPLGFNVAGEAIQVGVKRTESTFGKPISQLTDTQVAEGLLWAADRGEEYAAWRGAAENELTIRRERLAKIKSEPMDRVPAAIAKATREDLALDARLAAGGK